MQIDIQVVNVDAFTGVAQKGKNAGEEYTYYEVTYKELKTNKTNSKKIYPFGDLQVFGAVKKFTKGEKYTIVSLKEGEYWNWKEVKPYGSAPADQGTQAQTKSAYVPDDVKQDMIIRQSSLGNACRIAAAGGLNHEQAMQMAEDFVDWVYKRQQPKQEARKPKRQAPADESADFDAMDDDIPF